MKCILIIEIRAILISRVKETKMEYGGWMHESGDYIPVTEDHIETAKEHYLGCTTPDVLANRWVRIVWSKFAALEGDRDAIKTIWPKIAKRLLSNAVSVSIDFTEPYEGECFNMPMDRAKMVRWIMKS